MDVQEVEVRFAGGKVEKAYANCLLVIVLGRFVYFGVALWILWGSWHSDVWMQKTLDYAVVLFCLWRVYHQGDPLVFLCEKGLVIKRRPAGLFERVDMFLNPEYYYYYAPYPSIVGFTSNWEEMHIGAAGDSGIYIVPVDLQLVKYADKMALLAALQEKGRREES